MAERQSRGRKQPRIDGGVNLQVEASIGSRAERKSGSGAAAEDGGAGADLQRQSVEGATSRADRARASIRRRADGRSRGRPEQRRTGGRPEQNRRTGGRRAGCRRRAAEFQVRPVLSPLPSLLSFLRSLSLPALKRCGGPRGSIGTRFPAHDRLTLRVASSRRLGARGDAIRTTGVAEETPQSEARLDAKATLRRRRENHAYYVPILKKPNSISN